MSNFTAIARPVGIGLRTEIDVNGRHTISTDEPERLGGMDTAPAPHELLPAMLASCVSTMIMLYANRQGWRLEGMRVEVTYDTDPTPRAVNVAVHLPAWLTEAQAMRLRRIAETCPVRRALEAGFTFEEQIELDAPLLTR